MVIVQFNLIGMSFAWEGLAIDGSVLRGHCRSLIPRYKLRGDGGAVCVADHECGRKSGQERGLKRVGEAIVVAVESARRMELLGTQRKRGRQEGHEKNGFEQVLRHKHLLSRASSSSH